MRSAVAAAWNPSYVGTFTTSISRSSPIIEAYSNRAWKRP